MKIPDCYFSEEDGGIVFFPWFFMMALSALWCVHMPSGLPVRSLRRFVFVCHVAMIAIPLATIPISHTFGILPLKVVLSSWVVVFLTYSVVLVLRIGLLPRLTIRDGLHRLILHVGTTRFWQFAVFGFVFLPLAIVFQLNNAFSYIMIGILVANSFLAIYGLTLRRTMVENT